MIKYFTKQDLIRLNNKSIKNNKNRTLKSVFINKLPDNKVFPIIFDIVHNDHELRTQILFSENPNNTAFLDIDFKDYEKLPEVKEMEKTNPLNAVTHNLRGIF